MSAMTRIYGADGNPIGTPDNPAFFVSLVSPQAVAVEGIAAVRTAGGYVDEYGNVLEVKRAVIDHATSGDNTIVSAVGGKKIRVLSLMLVASASVTVRFESGASGTALTGQMVLQADGTTKTNGILVLPDNSRGWFETAASALLNLELSGNVSVDGVVVYVEAN